MTCSAFTDLRRAGERLRRDRRGLALLEFALSLPIALAIMMYAIELANYGLATMRVSQAALSLADNAGRVGTVTTLNQQELREVDINDVLQAMRLQTQGWNMARNARVTLSSLENVGGVQRIHWQRCLGAKSGTGFDSSFGRTKITDGTDATAANQGTDAPTGMGPPGRQVVAPPNSGVMFVEINYQYQPVITKYWLPSGAEKIRYLASFIVRDQRDFSQIYNPEPAATRATCDKYGI